LAAEDMAAVNDDSVQTKHTLFVPQPQTVP